MNKKKVWFYFVVLVLGFFYSNLVRISGVVVLPPLMESLGINAAMVGFLSSVFFYAYGGSFVFWGIVADRLGTFRTAGVSLLIAGSGALALMSSSSVAGIGLGRALSGLGLASAFPCVLLFCAAAFRREYYPLFVSLSMAIGHSGTVVAIAPLGAALDAFGYRGVYFFLALFAFVLGALLLLGREEDPQLVLSEKSGGGFSLKNFLLDLKEGALLTWHSFPLRVVGLTWGISAAAISTLQGLWAVTWLVTTTGAELSAIRFCATWISIGMVAGPVVGGVLTKRFPGSRIAFFTMCSLVELAWILWAALSFFGAYLPALSLAGFGIGFFSGMGFVYMGNAVRDLAPFSKNGAVLGMINMFLYLMVIVFQWGTGFVLDFFPSRTGPGAYTQMGYQIGFALILLLQGYSFLLILRVKSFRRTEPQ